VNNKDTAEKQANAEIALQITPTTVIGQVP
jgi:hypothetical protein